MKDFLMSYGATVFVSVLIVIALVLAIRKIIKDKKTGKSCSCGCETCAFKDDCHKN